jgi:acetyltransferase-like isoleucine patch superfamily enzyme
MKVKISILYAWFVRTLTYFLPNFPFIMRFRGFLYSLMMDKCGINFQVTSTTYFNTLSGIKIGDNIYIGHNNVIIGLDITINDEVIIGPNCVISGGNHVFKNGSFRFGTSIVSKVLIEKGSWIGANCTITGGTILPERSILAAGSVLTKKFENKESVYGGVPACFIKKIDL